MSKAKVWATSEDGKIEYVSLTKERLKEFTDVLRRSCILCENLFIATGLSSNPEAANELEGILSHQIKEGLSVLAIDKETGKVAGILLNSIQYKKNIAQEHAVFKEYLDNCKYQEIKDIYEVSLKLGENCDAFALYNADCRMDLQCLGVLPEYSGRGIGFKLCEVAVELATQLCRGNNVKTSLDDTELPLDPRPQIVHTSFSSFKSQKIGRKLNFDILKRISFDDLYHNGKSYTSILGNETKEVTKECKKLE